MNPETNKFEILYGKVEDLKDSSSCEKVLKSLKPSKENILVRADGSPVPDHWSIFTEGEKIVIKNYTFKVVHIGETYLVLEPVGVVEIGGEEK